MIYSQKHRLVIDEPYRFFGEHTYTFAVDEKSHSVLWGNFPNGRTVLTNRDFTIGLYQLKRNERMFLRLQSPPAMDEFVYLDKTPEWVYSSILDVTSAGLHFSHYPMLRDILQSYAELVVGYYPESDDNE